MLSALLAYFPLGLVPVLCTKTRRPSATSERVGQSFAVPELAAESAKVPLCSSLCLPPCGRLQSILLGGAVQDGFERKIILKPKNDSSSSRTKLDMFESPVKFTCLYMSLSVLTQNPTI